MPGCATASVADDPLPNPARRGPILLAIHGEEPTSAAITAARRLAERNELPLQVVTVVEYVRAFSGAQGMLPTVTTLTPAFMDQQAETVRRRLGDALGDETKWSLDVRDGSPAREIASAAREVDATAIVVDAAPRRGVRHVVSGARALQVVGRSSCPVLSVAPSFAIPPLTIVAAIDFSPASIHAAQAALLFAAERATVFLVHSPLPIRLAHAARDAAGALFGGDTGAYFARVRAELDPFLPSGVTIVTRTIEGSVVSGVLALAESEHADLIVAGTHGPGPVERFFVGSTAAGLLHGAPCPVLVSPPPGAAEFVRLELHMSGDATTHDPAAWSAVLAEATTRDGGRKVTVEVDDPSIGSRAQVEGFELRGIVYDPAGRRVEIMMDEGRGGAGHLTRTIANVESITIAADSDGRDRKIGISHGRGHTIVHFDD
jgi:nucleotide-binding universal stress UspA family protein